MCFTNYIETCREGGVNGFPSRPIFWETTACGLGRDIPWLSQLTGTALNPDLVGISLETTISTIAGASQTDKDTAVAQAIAAAADYVNNLAIGAPLVINDIAAAIQASSSKIKDVGDPNHMIDAIYIWRSRADGSRYSRTLLANYAPALGERICVEDIAP